MALCDSDTMPAAHASILHLDLDAFFAAVEQRDKPSLRGKPVVVGGTGGRGVVSTASYEARAFGARSAMPTIEARRLCPPGTAFLSGRYEAYRRSSAAVMTVLREASAVVEQVSVDEAYVDLGAADLPDLETATVTGLGQELQRRIAERTGGLSASIGIGTSKMIAKLGSEARKPGGLTVVPSGAELEFLHPLPVRAIPGVGPATAARLHAFGVDTVAALAAVTETDLVSIFGSSLGAGLARMARAEDTRTVSSEREVKSISAEQTYERDLTDPEGIRVAVRGLADKVTARLQKSEVFARTVTVKMRRHDFSTLSRSWTLHHATDDAELIAAHAQALVAAANLTDGVRLLGVGVAGLTEHAQATLWQEGPSLARPGQDQPEDVPDAVGASQPLEPASAGGQQASGAAEAVRSWPTGADVQHAEHGAGWVWGSGRGRVSVRFEGPGTPPGRVRTFASDDPDLSAAEPPWWPGALQDAESGPAEDAW